MGWRGPTEMRRKRELSAGECRGRPRHRGAAGKGANPLPLHGSLAHGDTAWARGWPARLAQGCLPPRPWGQGPLCTARMAWGQRLRPSPSSSIHPATSSFPGAQAMGCIPASPPPAGQRASPPLPWPGPPLGWAGEGSLLPSLGIPGSRHGATGAGGRTSRQREAEGRCQPTLCQHQFPAITAAARAAV